MPLAKRSPGAQARLPLAESKGVTRVNVDWHDGRPGLMRRYSHGLQGPSVIGKLRLPSPYLKNMRCLAGKNKDGYYCTDEPR